MKFYLTLIALLAFAVLFIQCEKEFEKCTDQERWEMNDMISNLNRTCCPACPFIVDISPTDETKEEIGIDEQLTITGLNFNRFDETTDSVTIGGLRANFITKVLATTDEKFGQIIVGIPSNIVNIEEEDDGFEVIVYVTNAQHLIERNQLASNDPCIVTCMQPKFEDLKCIPYENFSGNLSHLNNNKGAYSTSCQLSGDKRIVIATYSPDKDLGFRFLDKKKGDKEFSGSLIKIKSNRPVRPDTIYKMIPLSNENGFILAGNEDKTTGIGAFTVKVVFNTNDTTHSVVKINDPFQNREILNLDVKEIEGGELVITGIEIEEEARKSFLVKTKSDGGWINQWTQSFIQNSTDLDFHKKIHINNSDTTYELTLLKTFDLGDTQPSFMSLAHETAYYNNTKTVQTYLIYFLAQTDESTPEGSLIDYRRVDKNNEFFSDLVVLDDNRYLLLGQYNDTQQYFTRLINIENGDMIFTDVNMPLEIGDKITELKKGDGSNDIEYILLGSTIHDNINDARGTLMIGLGSGQNQVGRISFNKYSKENPNFPITTEGKSVFLRTNQDFSKSSYFISGIRIDGSNFNKTHPYYAIVNCF